MADSITIVLDPGHGGENLGLQYGGFLEKEMNLTVAQDMKQELEKYDGVTVYITNPECGDMSLKQRAEYAKSVEADLLISLHFNMSESHQMFGSEVWVPSKGENHAWMHTLGDIFLEELTDKGFLNRGVKTRLNGKGLDYYGILRESTALGVPSVLVEHCYADHEPDASYLKQSDSLHNFAVGDATAVAKFYGLKSESMGVDYSTYVKNAYFIPEDVVAPDDTAPEQVLLTYVNNGEEIVEGGSASFLLQAEDQESRLCYYEYSLDGGEHWSELYPWDQNAEALIFQVEGLAVDAQVVARVYNGHFLKEQSNTICFMETEEEPALAQEKSEIPNKIADDIQSRGEADRGNVYRGSAFCMLMLTLLLFLLCGKSILIKNKKRALRIAPCVLLGGILTAALFLRGASAEKMTAEETLAEQREETEEAVAAMSFHVIDTQAAKISETDAGCIVEQSRYEAPTEVVYDIARGYLRVPSIGNVPRNSYDFSRIIEQDGLKYYTDETGVIQSEVGVDVSKFQGNVDWALVKESGIDFAILRLGLRGYGSGKLVMDERFYENLNQALGQQIKVGVYFFSAAISEEEAIEEADYVASALSGYEIQMPVVFDTEPILYDDARTDGLTPNQLTAIARAFCERIREHGYMPMIYANAKRLTCVLHLEELSDIELWYADYEQQPIYPYAYRMWQYTEHGKVNGIEGEVDLNVYFHEEAE